MIDKESLKAVRKIIEDNRRGLEQARAEYQEDGDMQGQLMCDGAEAILEQIAADLEALKCYRR